VKIKNEDYNQIKKLLGFYVERMLMECKD